MSYPEYLTAEEKLTHAKAGLSLPTIVVLCGSTEFMDEFTEMNLQQTAKGRIVLSVGCNMKLPHPLWADPDEAEELKPRLDALHRAKIRLADRVIVVGTRIGSSTRAEIAYARQLGKTVWFAHPEVDPDLDAPECTAGRLPFNGDPVDRCVVRGPHDGHRTAAGVRWTDADSEVR